MPKAIELVFEWDQNKNQVNIKKHGIDFTIAVQVFQNQYLAYESSRNNEIRHVAVGHVDGKIIAVIYTECHEKIRIISARHAWEKEKRAYRALHSRYPSRTH